MKERKIELMLQVNETRNRTTIYNTGAWFGSGPKIFFLSYYKGHIKAIDKI